MPDQLHMNEEKKIRYCDFSCKYANFPPDGSQGICRTMSLVDCSFLKKFVNKNLLCEAELTEEETER